MLSNELAPGVLLIGLATFLNCPTPGFTGCYRIVQVGGKKTIEFFRRAPPSGQTSAIQILPYQPGQIAQMSQETVETISGEFTGCVMTVFRQRGNGKKKVGHVCTNADASQRAAYDAQKDETIQVIDEYDSTGKIVAYPQHTGATRILCVANGTQVLHYFVEKESHQYSGTVPVPGEPGKTEFGIKNETRYKVLASHGN